MNIRIASPNSNVYILKYFRLPFLTTPKNHFSVKNDTTNEAINPSPYGSIMSCMLFISNKSLKPNSVVPRLTGIYNINEYFNAVLLSKSLNNPPISVEPLLLIPGITAITCVIPMKILSRIVKSLSLFFPFMFLTKNKNSDVSRKAIPMIFTLFSFSY